MKIAFFEMQDWEKEYVTPKLQTHKLFFYQAGQDYLEKNIDVLSNFIGFPVGAEVLSSFPNLKYVTTRSTGFDHIDIKACQQKGIAVSNVPTYGENTVAEFAFALILALSRKIFPAIKRVREQGLFATEGLEGFDLAGKTIGIVGMGHIGVHVAKMAKGFDMTVLAYDPHPREDLSAQYGFRYVELDELLKQSDVVSLHVPYLPSTHHIINAEKFKLFKKNSLLINTARGGLVETESLVKALQGGLIAGAGLDVLEEEGFIKDEAHLLYQAHPKEEELKTILADHELMQMDNVLITPHNAFNSREAMQRILDTTIANILSFAGGKPTNLVK